MTTASEWAARFRSGDASPVDAVRACLDAIDRLDPGLGAFVTVTPEVALAAARAAEQRWHEGAPLSPIDGVPVAMKDLTATAGVRTTFGSASYVDHIPDVDAAYWARLAGAGAVLVGKTNTPEMGSAPTTENLIGPPTRNPWDTARTAGGSSGGAAVAVVAGMAPLAEGSDAAGSIRIPASCCGCVGIKPSRGRVSEGPLFGEYASGLATSGPMAMTVADCLLMLEAMQGPDPGDPYPPPARRPVRPARRVGVVEGAAHAPVDPEVRAALDRVAAELEGLGVTVEPVALPLEGFLDAVLTIFAVATAATPFPDPSRCHPVVQMMLERAKATSGVALERARVRMHRQARALRLAMDPFDAVLLPVLTTPPKPLGFLDGITRLDEALAWLPYTYPFNATGQPAVALPGHMTGDGLPVGVQLVGRLGEDETVASLAASWEDARGLPHPAPNL